MRDYAKIAPTFWVGTTGKKLRGNKPAQIVALYLQSSPHASMIGVFNCPPVYIAHDTGLSVDEVAAAIDVLQVEGFCTYDEDHEWIWVHEMARYQIGEALKEKDNRREGVVRALAVTPDGPLKQGFLGRYASPYGMANEAPSKGPPKPLPSQEQEQEQAHAQDHATPRAEGARTWCGGRTSKELQDELADVVGADVSKQPGLADFSPILTLLDGDYDWSRDIVEGARAARASAEKQGKPIRTWRYVASTVTSIAEQNRKIPAKPAEPKTNPGRIVFDDEPIWKALADRRQQETGKELHGLTNYDPDRRGYWFHQDWIDWAELEIPEVLKVERGKAA